MAKKFKRKKRCPICCEVLTDNYCLNLEKCPKAKNDLKIRQLLGDTDK